MIKDYLGYGPEEARSWRYLCKMLNCSRRELVAGVERERREGAAICANNGRDNPGYYLARDREEFEEYIQRLKHRAKEISITSRYCQRTAAKMPGRDQSALHL